MFSQCRYRRESRLEVVVVSWGLEAGYNARWCLGWNNAVKRSELGMVPHVGYSVNVCVGYLGVIQFFADCF